MSMRCSYCWILLIICWLKFDNGDTQVAAQIEATKVQNYPFDNYEKYNVQDSNQFSNNYTDAIEDNKVMEKPKVKLKWVNKQKSRKKKREKGRHSKSKKKTSKSKAREKRKRKSLAKKFVKTVNYRNRDSNMSDSQEYNFDENQVDVILHILK